MVERLPIKIICNNLFSDGTSNVSIKPDSSTYELGDELVCSADGNPPPSFQWRNLLTGDTSSGPIVVISKSLTASTTSHFMCTASNMFDGKSVSVSNNISFTITVARTSSTASIERISTTDSSKSSKYTLISFSS